MSAFSEWYSQVEYGEECSIHDRVWDGDYCKSRDIQGLLEEAFEAGYLKGTSKEKLNETSI